ncbi:triokinase/FMN cyclase-like [Melitaea cinxia]|uniref:triokinase/FMN cyclase-like n=1 Tax=Melitaea cinxia TaxID=113334 RepID=UPI001E271CB7|nr:triokinase/FMN cyclase-like [Melitaea cinxia]
MTSSQPITKKVINSPETCVDDNLRGVVTLFPKLQLHPKHRVVTVRRKNDSGRVAILSGGGSGHEPFAAGFVGAGMLDGAVAGGVFASPPTGNVLYAIAHLYKYNSGGVLVLLGNYTGDRLNFGKAFEKAKSAGIKVDGYIVGEDVASCQNKTGGRGMCGEVLLFKMCGAMAEKGYDMDAILNMVEIIHKNMATLGVCLTSCSLPGQPPLFNILPDEMELGAGVHGEAGIEKLKMKTAKEIVALILDKVIARRNIEAEDRVVAMINNMGGTSLMEMNIIAAEIKDYLNEKQIKLERIYSGHYKTSLEMHGFQICLLRLPEENKKLFLELLDAPTEVGVWSGGVLSKRREGEHVDDDTLLQSVKRKADSGPVLPPNDQKMLRDSLQAAATELIKNEELLNKLDSGCGDGDCGITLKNFGKAILKYLESASFEYPANVLWDLSEIAETDMGGTSGGIYSLGLSAASQALATSTTNDRKTWLKALKGGMKAIMTYGGAEPGDRTMLDTLHAVMEVFQETLEVDIITLLVRINEAAQKGAENTAKMEARAGRASYVSSEHLQGEDAGARGVAIWLEAALSTVTGHH